jgi:hypothetical protein
VRFTVNVRITLDAASPAEAAVEAGRILRAAVRSPVAVLLPVAEGAMKWTENGGCELLPAAAVPGRRAATDTSAESARSLTDEVQDGSRALAAEQDPNAMS